MERGLLSDANIIETSKKFVCVRLHAMEDGENAELARKLGGRAPNVEFYLLDPTGEKVFDNRGNRSMGQFITASGGPSGIVAKMEAIATTYPGTKSDPGPAPVPWMKSVRESLIQANCDAEPVLLLIADESEQAKAMQKAVAAPELLSRFRTQFFYVKVQQDSSELSTYQLPQRPALIFLRPSQLGTKAVIMETAANPENLGRCMEDALKEFASAHEKLSREETLLKGQRENIRQPGASPSRPRTGPGRG